MYSRRNFLKLSSVASASLLMPQFLKGLSTGLFKGEGRKLVIIQLSGGNDGLNTVVPFEDDAYFQARNTLAISKNEVIKLNDRQGFNPALEALHPLYEQGLMTILNSVGYPNPDRSHFRSMDIWHTGSDSDQYWETGWLGRYLDASCNGCASPHKVLEIDDTLSLAVKGKLQAGLAMRDARQLYKHAKDPYLRAIAESYTSQRQPSSDLDFLYKTMTETLSSADYMYEKTTIQRSSGTYPTNDLGRRLKIISELIISGVETEVFYVSTSGFDTHVRQRGQHDRLLKGYAESVAAFVEDLTNHQRLQDTLIVTFSEFGRRLQQNASGGTDHGKANNLFVIGNNLKKPGIFNPPPDLRNLDDGDVRYEIDFRQVYATLLSDWLGADESAILTQSYKKLNLV